MISKTQIPHLDCLTRERIQYIPRDQANDRSDAECAQLVANAIRVAKFANFKSNENESKCIAPYKKNEMRPF